MKCVVRPESTADLQNITIERCYHAVSPSRCSWRRRGQYLLVLRSVVLVIVASGDEDQVVVHLIAREDLPEFGDEQTGLQVAGELTQGLLIVQRCFADQVADGPMLLGLVEAALDDL